MPSLQEIPPYLYRKEQMKFYTSDLHFDHSNMLEYEHRPWDTVEKMNEGLLFRINNKVGVNDELYILGDFTLRSTRSAVEEFRNGIICNHVHLITGNQTRELRKAPLLIRGSIRGSFHDVVYAVAKLYGHFTIRRRELPNMREGGHCLGVRFGQTVLMLHLPLKILQL